VSKGPLACSSSAVANDPPYHNNIINNSNNSSSGGKNAFLHKRKTLSLQLRTGTSTQQHFIDSLSH
jgi:hypothetical protein